MNSMMNAGALGVEITISGKLRSERAHFEKYVSGVVPKSGETADRIVRRATTDVLLKMGLFGVKVNIAIKNSIAPDVELIEPTASPISTESDSEEKSADQAGQQEQKEGSAPRSSRRSSTSKKESKKGNETPQN
jgi:small subunit ribosomal protein S3